MKKSLMAFVKSRAMIYVIAAVLVAGAIGGVVLVKHLNSNPTGKGENQEDSQKEDDIGLKPAEDGDEDEEYIQFDDDSKDSNNDNGGSGNSNGNGNGNGGSTNSDKNPDSGTEDGGDDNSDNDDNSLNDGSDGRLF